MPLYYSLPAPSFQRAMRNILSITQAEQAVITTTFDGINPGAHQYETGLIVSLWIPDGFGMTQAHQLYFPIIVLNPTQFSIPISTLGFDPFVIPPIAPHLFYTPAQVVPIGEKSDILTGATQNVLPYP
jgi:hypothetical protein